ncbi:MAG: DoxX family protein [Candidatus Marinimicrobia bacterium]|nr:DoxX family protein [Candidatus Neomarinimicrobiota bacterium]
MQFLNQYGSNSHWLVRASLAGTFIFHGYGKIPMAAQMSEMMGMPIAMIYMLAMMEIVGGALVLWGGIGPDWATRIAGGIFSATMMGAIGMVHWGQWSFMITETHPMGGMEFQVLILSISLMMLTRGNSLPKS